VLVLTAVLTWAFWPDQSAPEPPRARPYLEYTACLLTGEQGITDPDAAPVWAGLQDGSTATQAKIQYLAVVGPQNIENAQTFLNGLAQANCSLIFGAGQLATATIDSAASEHPDTRFLPVSASSSHPNVTPIAPGPPEQVRTAVRDALTLAVQGDSA
jgi:hypothetical protein